MLPRKICNDEFEVVRITPDLYDAVAKLFLSVFPNCENYCIATKVKDSPHAMSELHQLLNYILNEGISFAARHLKSGQLVAMCGNKLRTAAKDKELNELFASFTSPSLKTIDVCLTRMDAFDIFKVWQLHSAVELEYLAVDPAWSRRGLGLALANFTLDFFRAMSEGKLPTELLAQLDKTVRYERPQALFSTFTTLFTQRIGEKIGLQPVTTVAMSEFSFEGKSFDQLIDPMHKCSQRAALKF